MAELSDGVKKIIDNWYKGTEFEVIYFWEQDDTWFVIVRITPTDPLYLKIPDELHFCRVFPSYRIPKEYHISVDKKVDL